MQAAREMGRLRRARSRSAVVASAVRCESLPRCRCRSRCRSRSRSRCRSRCCRTVALADLDLLPPCCLLRFPFLSDLVPLPPPLRRETLKKQTLSSVFFGRPEPPRRPRPHPPLRRRRPGSRQQKPAPPLGARLRPGPRPRPAGFDSLRRRPRQPRRGPGLPHDRRRPPRRRLAHPGDQVDAVERL